MFFGTIFHRISYELVKRNPFKIYDCYKKWIVFGYPLYKRCQGRTLKRIKKKKHANVIFFAVVPSMWRYQGIYELLSKDGRFNVNIVLCSFKEYSTDLKEKNFSLCLSYFQKQGIGVIDAVHSDNKETESLLKELKPDILFYVQPYFELFNNKFDVKYHRDKLLCYIPYALGIADFEWMYNSALHNLAWKLFYANSFNRENAIKRCFRKDENVCVVGEPNADLYLEKHHHNPWKKCGHRKKIIYAPHFTIKEGGEVYRDCFLWSAYPMLDIAERLKDYVQIAFKPHPRLLTELYKHPEWGKEKADQYYQKWVDLENGQLEEGSFTDLFAHSDALIHDCGSFTAEYLYMNKPCMFLTRNPESVRNELDEFGKACFDLHYSGKSPSDIEKFIEEIVINNADTKLAARTSFYNKHLLPPNGKTVAENIYDEIVSGLFE